MNNVFHFNTIVTHDGLFHGDEVVAVAVLRELNVFTNIIRTRNLRNYEGRDGVLFVDVGQQYNPEKGHYDHHQKGGAGSRPSPREGEVGLPYASAGLIWKHFGFLFVDKIVDDLVTHNALGVSVTIEMIQEIVDQIDRNIIQHVDAHDVKFGSYKGLTLSNTISGFNPNWYETNTEESRLTKFHQAVDVATSALKNAIASSFGIVSAREIVKSKIAASQSRQYFILEQFVPWVNTAVSESEELLFGMFPTTNGGWNVQAIPSATESGKNRKNLPEHWCGLTPEQLRVVTGVQDAVFCHDAGFICGARSKEGALELLRLALEA